MNPTFRRVQHVARGLRAAGASAPGRGSLGGDSPLTVDPYPSGCGEAIVVYGRPTSRVTKVLWAAAEVGREIAHVGTLWEERRSAWYLALNPKGTVPTLRHGALVVNESNSAVGYLLHKFGDPSLYPANDPAALALCWQWAEWSEGVLAPAQNNIFFPVVRGTYAPGARLPGCPPS